MGEPIFHATAQGVKGREGGREGGKAEGDTPAEGSFWIDPIEGRVVRSTMRIKQEGAEIQITVTYGPNAKAGRTWVPVEMREVYTGTTRKLECTATYSNIRRFQVLTGVQMPK